MDSNADQVAIFIDFENLVYGIQDPKKNNSHEEEVDVEPIVRLAEEYGRVVQAHAYADWRNRVFNQYQVDLYKLGIDIVHVMGKKSGTGFKNAVDIKMAVDTIETIFTFPGIKTFLIVSGDRDFIHVLKMLRRHGRQIVGISPSRSASEDLAQLTDRFLRYESLTTTYFQDAGETEEEMDTSKLELLQKALREIVSERPEGLKGSELKGLLRRKISATFDESEYGFPRFIDLVRAFPNDMRVIINPDGGDMTVLPVATQAKSAASVATQANVAKTDDLLRAAGLRRYRYEINPRRRRNLLKGMFESMKSGSFSQNDVYEYIQNQQGGTDLSATELSKYFMILFQSRILWTESADDEDLPARSRKMVLNKAIKKPDDLIKRYEYSILYKVMERKNRKPFSVDELCALLGLKSTKDNLAYVTDLEAQVKQSLSSQK
ncbi:MAG: NYN domain-containing protein [Bacteroidia bacterium]|nr:NYN domain-containing protein [Bacteroidia bacterium]